MNQKDYINFIVWPQIPKCYGPIFFRTRGDAETLPSSVGSYTLVDTGKKRILVTNAHVLDGFDKQRKQNPNLAMYVGLHGGPVFELISKQIDYNVSLDLTTFDVTGLSVPGSSHAFVELPIKAPALKDNQRVFSLGYPGHFKKSSLGEVYFGTQPCALNITRINGDRSFSCDIKEARFDDPQMAVGTNEKLPGLSGGPCFLVHKVDAKPILIGITKEVRPMPFINENAIEYINAQRINRDGTLNIS